MVLEVKRILKMTSCMEGAGATGATGGGGRGAFLPKKPMVCFRWIYFGVGKVGGRISVIVGGDGGACALLANTF